jgi:hypothetical protein
MTSALVCRCLLGWGLWLVGCSDGDSAARDGGGGGGSCSEDALGWLNEVERVVAAARACSTDEDCVRVDNNLDCSGSYYAHSCGVAVAKTMVDSVSAELTRQQAELCTRVTGTCASSSLCPPTLAPHCRAKLCRYE